ncbi:MAG: bifunctional riboflavin kinase/FAD synthetase [Bryobacterales bacterium]|nr:bifunctional riboflavin kinase/FAD synthetase [Bryobacterales bacterium]MBV9397013.1 bifunctional riboflavin kinase/FAD synthetase [Bryobacterales bacterium]
MRIARTLEEAAAFGPCALTIGKFDGVHSGHAFLLRQVVETARQRGLAAAAMTFHPHPACIVSPERAPKPLISLEDRCRRMRELGIQQVFIVPFTQDVARLSPEEFVRRFVEQGVKARVVLVGENFRFGHKQSGDPRTLAMLGERNGFETRLIPPVKCRGEVVSTSAIRARLENGDVAFAARLLGRPYGISGEVVHGFGIGAKQTVPTLNLRPPAEVLPRTGVYITHTADNESHRCWNSITNVGLRPTFGGDEVSIETYLLDPLEGGTPASIRVAFLRRVRDERKFESPDALKKQIFADVGRAQAFFRRAAKWVKQPYFLPNNFS